MSCSALRNGWVGGRRETRETATAHRVGIQITHQCFNKAAFYIDVRCDVSLLFCFGLFRVAASHTGPKHTRYSCLVQRSTFSLPWLPLGPFISRTWLVTCGRAPGLLLLAPLRPDSCSSTDVSRYNIYLWSWGSSFEHPSFFRLDFVSCFLFLLGCLMTSNRSVELVTE